MAQARQLTIGAGMLAIAVAGIACADVSFIIKAWEPLSYYLGWLLRPGSWVWLAVIAALVLLGPCLLVGLGLLLFPIRTDHPNRADESANSDIDEP
jgi:hypothetical protein